MSRIGRMPVTIPAGVRVAVEHPHVRVEGPKGKIVIDLVPGIDCVVEGASARLTRADDSKPRRSQHGLFRQLVANAVKGAASGWTRDLEIEGIGYRAQLQGRELSLTLGYSHPISYPIPEGINIMVDKQTKLAISGADRQRVGQVAAEIRALRPPEPYKGKGIRYAGEVIKRKVGKTGA